ncbi:hypothetical protein EVAR_16547_1 [Eumeta japonica]|uniref:Uncharacterized protein n=1 Tax=Eumeta variegata TaxID=151549 RepID=A0A4C1U3N6_EUMVA|nr:hypothetical protein EVAR_16547_1 [Eumeta japonica]
MDGKDKTGNYIPGSSQISRNTVGRGRAEAGRGGAIDYLLHHFRDANEHARQQRPYGWSSPPMDTRNPRGVTGALPTSWVGIKCMPEERVRWHSGTFGSGREGAVEDGANRIPGPATPGAHELGPRRKHLFRYEITGRQSRDFHVI